MLWSIAQEQNTPKSKHLIIEKVSSTFSAKTSWSTNVKFTLVNECLGYNNCLLAVNKFQSLAKVRWACISLDAFNIHMSDDDFFSYLLRYSKKEQIGPEMKKMKMKW